MRKVKNSSNIKVLDKFGKSFILPLLQIILHAKKDGLPLDSSAYFGALAALEKKVLQVALDENVVSRKNKKNGIPGKPAISLRECCNNIIAKKTVAEIENVITIYLDQQASLAVGNYKIGAKKIDLLFQTLFSEYLYVKLFDNKKIWIALGLPVLTRTQFHENFKKDNIQMFVCPYCDLDTIISKGSHQVEHFLPKAKFPLLALDPRNLISACVACNMPSGKGSKVVAVVTSPYCCEIGRKVKFEFLNSKQQLRIYALPEDAEIDGYLSLVSLPERYLNPDVWRVFNARKNAFSESMQNRNARGLQNALLYAEEIQVAAPLTYALKYWIQEVGKFY